MIDFKEIELSAYSNNPLPKRYPSQAEQFAYLSMRALYNDYRKKNLGKEQAQQERLNILHAYESAIAKEEFSLLEHKAFDNLRVALGGCSKQVESGNCEVCKRIMRIIDGRIQL